MAQSEQCGGLTATGEKLYSHLFTCKYFQLCSTVCVYSLSLKDTFFGCTFFASTSIQQFSKRFAVRVCVQQWGTESDNNDISKRMRGFSVNKTFIHTFCILDSGLSVCL